MGRRFTSALTSATSWAWVAAVAVALVARAPALAAAWARDRATLAVVGALFTDGGAWDCAAIPAAAPRAAEWRALCALEGGDLPTARHMLSALYRQDPGNARLYAPLSATYERSARPQDVLAVADLWVAIGSSGPEWQREGAAAQLLRIGQARQREGRRHDAFLLLRAAWKLSPEDPDVAYYLAYAAHEIGDPDAALLSLWQAARARPARVAVRAELERRVRPDAAKAEAERLAAVARANPGDAETALALGRALLRAGRSMEEALAATRRGIDALPDRAEGYVQMGDLLRHAGQELQAVAWYERAVEMEADPPAEALLGLGLAWYDARRYARAVPWLEEAARDDLGVVPWDALAASYLYTGQCERALAAGERAARLSDNPVYDLSLTHLRAACGEGGPGSG